MGLAPDVALEDRVARFKVSMDPRVLWPEVRPESLSAGLRAITQATRDVLAERPSALPPADADPSPRALGVAAYISGMGPMLGHWIAEGRLVADSDEAALLGQHLEQGRRRHALLQERLTTFLDALRPHDITPIVLKGMDTAARYLPAPGTRTIGDIDLLVHPEEAGLVRAVLADKGFVERPHSGQPSRSEWVPHGVGRIRSLEIDHSENPWAVDLHVALERYYHRGLVASLGARAFEAVSYELAGRPVRGLAQPVLTAWLAIHGAYGIDSLQLARLVELALVIRKDVATGALSWDELTRVLDQTRTTRFTYPTLALVEHLAPGTIPGNVVRHAASASTRRAQRVVAALAASGTYRLRRRSLEDRFMWARGPLELALLLTDVVWPTGATGPAAVGRLYLRRARAALLGRLALRAEADGS